MKMKARINFIYLSILVGALSLSACNSSPVTPESKSWPRVHYDLQPGVKSSELQGSPWINSNLPGMTAKVQKPSLKDDFYASVNYDELVNNEPGPFNISANNVRNQLDQILNEDTSCSNSKLLQKAYDYVSSGANSEIHNYLNSVSLTNYVNHKDLFIGNNSYYSLNLTDNGNYQIAYNDGYYEGDYAFHTFMFLGSQYEDRKNTELAIRDNLFTAFNYQLDEQTYSTVSNMEFNLSYSSYLEGYYHGYSLKDYVIGGENSYTFLNNALIDLGFNQGDTLKISNLSLAATATFNEYLSYYNYSSILAHALKCRMMFEYRFFSGAEHYRPLSKILHDSGLFYYESDLTDYDDVTVSREMMKQAFVTILDKAYIELFSSIETKQYVSELIEIILNGYRSLAEKEDWIDNYTKNGLLRKINNMSYVSCYSDTIKNYPDISETGISTLSILNIYHRYREFMTNLVISKTIETNYFWSSMPSFTVNAFYSAGENQFVILNGLLSGGFIGETIEETLGGLGVVIGHEISHSIDEGGSQFDEYGRYNNWWSAKSKAEFNARLKKLKDYYNKINLFDDVNVNGNQVNTEVTADMGGLSVCLEIAKTYTDFDYDLFFRTFARTWLSYAFDQRTINLYLKDSHPFDYLRCNVSIAQFDEFVETYDIKKGDGMYFAPEDRIAIW